MTDSFKRFPIAIALISLCCACATPPAISPERFFPTASSGQEQTIKRTPSSGWSVVEKKAHSTIEAKLSAADDYVLAYMRVQNIDSKTPLAVSRIYVSDGTQTLLKSESAERIAAKYRVQAAQLYANSSDAAEKSQSAVESVRAKDTGLNIGIAIGAGIANAMLSGVYGRQAKEVEDAGKFISENAYENQLIPQGLANEGLVLFKKGDRTPPFTVHVDISDGTNSDQYSMEYDRGDAAELFSYLQGLPEGDRISFSDWGGPYIQALLGKLCESDPAKCEVVAAALPTHSATGSGDSPKVLYLWHLFAGLKEGTSIRLTTLDGKQFEGNFVGCECDKRPYTVWLKPAGGGFLSHKLFQLTEVLSASIVH